MNIENFKSITCFALTFVLFLSFLNLLNIENINMHALAKKASAAAPVIKA
jgi:hypothetical protein